ncbi:MAG: hypothetical protein AAF721_04915 [Myxococcota bacterium]
MSKDFDALVARGRSAPGPTPQQLARKKASRATARARLVDDALAGAHRLLGSAGPIAVVGIAGAGAFAALARWGLPPWAAKVAAFLLIAATGIGLFVTLRYSNRILAGYELRALARLPFKVGIQGYLGALGVERKTARAVVTVHFDAELSPGQRDEVTAAMDGLAAAPIFGDVVDPTTDVGWTGADLRITGPRVSTHSSHPGELNPERYGNARIHQWVRRFLAKGASPLHQRFPLDSVTISVRE